MLGRTLALAGVLLACAAPLAQAQSAAQEVFGEYARDGAIDPCEHTAHELQLALDSVPPDVEQYAAEYPGAIETAIEARARGECSHAAATPTPTAAPAGAPAPTPSPTIAATVVPTTVAPAAPTVPDPPAPVTTGSTPQTAQPDPALERAASATPSSDAPAPVIALGVLATLIALTALLFVALRRLGVADDWLAPAAHAWREAAWRAEGTWADFRDWLRIGR